MKILFALFSFSPLPSEKGRGRKGWRGKREGGNEKEQRNDKRKIGRQVDGRK